MKYGIRLNPYFKPRNQWQTDKGKPEISEIIEEDESGEDITTYIGMTLYVEALTYQN